MATTAAFSALSVPAPDDTMEMSSPANHNLDDDIDIDFDDYQGGVNVTDDDRMLEDGEQTRPATATDDMMEDDILPSQQNLVEEEVMRDDDPLFPDVQQDEDEELIDYGEDDVQDQAVDDTVLPEVTEEPSVPLALDNDEYEQVDEEIVREPEDGTIEQPVQDGVDQAEAEVEQVLEAPAEAFSALHEKLQTEQAVQEDTDDAVAHSDAKPSAAEEASTYPPLQVNTTVSAASDTPGTPTDTGLHPMTVRYSDLLIPLFKSRRQPDGLLKDDNLASLSLAELIQNCRQRLAFKIGEDISEDQELVLGFDHMGLMLVEVSDHETKVRWTPLTVLQDSRAAFESSLNDVLDVYLQLHRNDGTNDIPPLSLNLSLQLKFASSFSVLKQAAANGQGMSSFGFLQSGPQHEEEYYHEDHDEDVFAEAAETHENHDGSTSYEAEFPNHGHGDELLPPAQETYADPEGYEHQQDYQEQVNFHQEDENEHHSTVVGNETGQDTYETNQEDGQGADADYKAPEDPSIVDGGEFGAPLETTKSAQKAESTASSQTVQGDHADDTAGEYDDLIDWDDDLTIDVSEPTTEAHTDFSTFLTEYEDEEVKAELPTEDQLASVNAHADVATSGLPAKEPTGVDEDIQHLGSEDFLNDLEGHENEDFGEQQHYERYTLGEGYEDQEQQYDDQADTHDEQRDEEEYLQPGDDEDHLNGTEHLQDGEYYEREPDHGVYANDDGLVEAAAPVNNEIREDEAQYDFGDDIGFDDEEPEDQEHEPSPQPAFTAKASDSPLGKRSFDEIDELGDEEPDSKKARSS